MNSIQLKGNKRSATGKKASTHARRADMVPCVLYGGENVVEFESEYNAFRHLIYTDKFYRVELEIEGNKYEAMVKDVQFDPITDKIVHVDFQELSGDRVVKAEIPVKLTGFSAGVQEGGKLMLKMRKLALKAYPQDIPDDITLDVTDLELGKSIRVRDISVPNCQIMNSAGNPVASVVIPRVLKAEPGEIGADGQIVPEEGAAIGEGEGDGDGGEAKEGGEG
ncbi:MAG: 50S ribosomal protein L25 [Chitinophagales bacterium]|nr:50S ribosomal protein L25 [Chitinophagales bacterium]